jgi:hypothetical protein
MGIEPTSELTELSLRIYAFSMPNLEGTGTEANQLDCENLQSLGGFSRRRSVVVSVRIKWSEPPF